ncbi:MAG: Glyoxalase/bleomycin resistance protein/dioxygenase [Solirubrobacterales bacterium]|nr:Glyoxalase/bleomycin resistance protein/dioxygenase [Solirubrobacterales bacterium]
MSTMGVAIDHVTVGVSDLDRSHAFYVAALAPLGFDHVHTTEVLPNEVELGVEGRHPFAISTDYPVGAPVHVAFAAESREQVDAFHAAALAAGGRDNGAPGPRPEYSPGYYGAFVLDPDGHNVEAVLDDGRSS